MNKLFILGVLLLVPLVYADPVVSGTAYMSLNCSCPNWESYCDDSGGGSIIASTSLLSLGYDLEGYTFRWTSGAYAGHQYLISFYNPDDFVFPNAGGVQLVDFDSEGCSPYFFEWNFEILSPEPSGGEVIPEFDFKNSSFAAFVGIVVISIAAVFFMRRR
jgi:hypothetical protein